MTEIRRYATWVDHCDDYWEAEDPDGQWVKWEDVQDLLARVAQLEKCREFARHLHGCQVSLRLTGDPQCSCGLDELEAALKDQP